MLHLIIYNLHLRFIIYSQNLIVVHISLDKSFFHFRKTQVRSVINTDLQLRKVKLHGKVCHTFFS